MKLKNIILVLSGLVVNGAAWIQTSHHQNQHGVRNELIKMMSSSSPTAAVSEHIDSDDVFLNQASDFMLSNFWGVDSSSDGSSSLKSEILNDLREKYGERMGKRLLKSVILNASDDKDDKNNLIGMLCLEVSLLHEPNTLEDEATKILSSTNAETLLKNTVANLGPKQRRQYKDFPLIDLVTELLPEYRAIVLLSNLCVSKDARGKGVAFSLCKYAEESLNGDSSSWNGEEDFNEIYLKVEESNESAVNLYKSKLMYTEVPGAGGEDTAMRAEGNEFVEVDSKVLYLKKGL